MQKLFFTAILVVLNPILSYGQSSNLNAYPDLEKLYEEWRTFEKPPLLDGAPDYRKTTFEERQSNFIQLQTKLKEIDTVKWTIP